MDDFSKIIGLAADNHEAYYYRGNASFNLKQAKEALLDYNQAIKLNPDYKEAYANRAYCKQYLKDNDGACNDFKKAVALGMPDLGDKLNMCR
jgi:tetratricopeptide (TPR) repeat protein